MESPNYYFKEGLSMELFTSNENITDKKYTLINSLEELSVNEIKELIFNKVYGIRYMNRLSINENKKLKKYTIGENNKVVHLLKEDDINGDYYSLVLVHYAEGETRFMMSVDSDIKRFNSILRDFMQF